MDFAFTEAQDEVRDLARRILEDKVTVALLTEVDSRGEARFDPGTWAALAQANLVGMGLAEERGGSGYGLIEQCLVLREIGRTVAPAPFLASNVVGAAAIDAFGTAEQQERWVRPAAGGDLILTAALSEPLNRDPLRPVTTARPVGGGWRLDGVKTCVPAATLAGAILVPATLDDGRVEVFVVEPTAPGVVISPQRTSNRDLEGYLELDEAQVGDDARIGPAEADGQVADWMLERATLGLCAVQLGVTERALAETASYATHRIQFERPIATFQAVGHRLADAYIDVQAIELTTWQAAWRLAAGLPAGPQVAVAKYWAALGGHRVAHAVVHVHGGMGVATEYFIHRYFLAAKQIEFTLGGAKEQLLRLGAHLAVEPV